MVVCKEVENENQYAIEVIQGIWYRKEAARDEGDRLRPAKS